LKPCLGAHGGGGCRQIEEMDEQLCGGFTLGSGSNALVGYLIKNVLKSALVALSVTGN